jgi:flavin reductase (DIM6/NTAB) family NADH-FMN oxidoreductase RutF
VQHASAADDCALAATGVLITTGGRPRANVMASESVTVASHDPFLLVTFIKPGSATHADIERWGEFGVNVCSDQQLELLDVAGIFSGRSTDKLTSELFTLRPAQVIGAPLISGCVQWLECRLAGQWPVGDHIAYLGEVAAVTASGTARPLVRHRRTAFPLGPPLRRAPYIGLTVTPARCGPGSSVRVAGNVFRRPAGTATAEIQVTNGTASWNLARFGVGPRGQFGGEVTVPRQLGAGRWRLIASAGDLTGAATLTVFRAGRADNHKTAAAARCAAVDRPLAKEQ